MGPLDRLGRLRPCAGHEASPLCPGTLLSVLANPRDAYKLTDIIFSETTTLGVRRREERRLALARSWKTISTAFGPVRVKVASLNGTVTGYAAENEVDFIEKTILVMRNQAKHHQMCRAARDQAQSLSWDSVFEKVYNAYELSVSAHPLQVAS